MYGKECPRQKEQLVERPEVKVFLEVLKTVEARTTGAG